MSRFLGEVARRAFGLPDSEPFRSSACGSRAYHRRERVIGSHCRGPSGSPAYHLEVHQHAVACSPHVCQEPTVPVTGLYVSAEHHDRSRWYQTSQCPRGFTPEAADGFSRVDGLGRIDAQQTHRLFTQPRDDGDSVAVYRPADHGRRWRRRPSALIGTGRDHGEAAEQREAPRQRNTWHATVLLQVSRSVRFAAEEFPYRDRHRSTWSRSPSPSLFGPVRGPPW